MLKSLLIVVAVAGLVAAGVVEGLRTNRWGASDEIQTSASRLPNIPTQVGDWRSTERTMDEKVQRVAGAVGYIDRCYVNAKTGEVMDILILSGPSGSIAAHTPDVCYAGIGYTMKDVAPVRKAVTIPGLGPITYWSARFEKGSSANGSLQSNWAWGVDGDWAASEAPRSEFMLRQSLYKLYVTRRVARTDKDGSQASAIVEEFMTEFLPAVKTALAAPSG